MNSSIGIIGGADGPTAIYVTGSVGQTVLTSFLLLLAALALGMLAAKLLKKLTPFAVVGAALVVATFPTLLVYVFLSKKIQESFIAGAVKG